MKKLIRPQDVLLLTLAGIGDLFEEIRDPGFMISDAYKNVYGFIPSKYKRNNFLRSVDRSLKIGYIEKIEKNGEVYLRLTNKGNKKIYRDFSLLSLSKKGWDKKWRIVFFDIEEISRSLRNKLRVKLKELGFAMLQKSVWITPYDIMADFYEYIQTIGLAKNVFLVEGKNLLGGDPKELAQKIWQINELNKEYERIEKEINKLKQLGAKLDDRSMRRKAKSINDYRLQIERIKRKLRMDYLKVLLSDPHLPKELLPGDWAGEKVKKLIKNL